MSRIPYHVANLDTRRGLLSGAERARMRRRVSRGDRRRRRDAAVRLQRRDAARALPRHRRSVRQLPAHDPLRAQSQLDAGRCASAPRAWRRGRRQHGGGSRGGAQSGVSAVGDRFHRRRQIAGGARMRRQPWRQGDQCGIGRRARARRGDCVAAGTHGALRRACEPRHRREEPSAHLHGAQDQ